MVMALRVKSEHGFEASSTRVWLVGHNTDELTQQHCNPVTGTIQEVDTGISKFVFEGV